MAHIICERIPGRRGCDTESTPPTPVDQSCTVCGVNYVHELRHWQQCDCRGGETFKQRARSGSYV